ncbi:MAG TPA: TolC family protein [Gemmatimonadaceae bacterium]|jgi:outer membrane protein TolC|nr:TolC family protein [Gemmatimonadaceae bacterium]
MNVNSPKAIRIGAVLSVIAALVAFAVRASEAQTPTPPPPRKLSLGEAARLAASQVATVMAARLRVDEAKARVTQARADLLPQISAFPNWSSVTINSASFGIHFPTQPGQAPLFDPNGSIIGPINLFDFRAGLTQTLWDPATKAKVAAAQSNVTAAGGDVASAEEQAASVAAVTYVRAQRAEAVVGARAADSVLATELVSIARDQLSAGVGVALDVTRAQSQLASSRAQLIIARNDRDRSLLELRRALNIDLDTPLQLTDSLEVPESESIENETAAADVAMKMRPDVRALDLQYAAAQQQYEAIRAGRLPSVGFFGRDGYNGLTLNHLLNTYSYGVQFTWPAFEGHRREGQEAEQSAVIREIDAHRRDLRKQVAADVRGALLDLGSAREEIDAARENQRLAQQEVAQARERFRAGVAGNADVVTASFTLNQARTTLIDALNAYQNARVSLARAQGVVSQIR